MKNMISWSIRIIVAIIMLQTLYFKFTGAEESVYIFTTVGMEPWGRIGSGVAELVASILILLPATVFLGALIAIGVISGAIFFHITVLGLEVKGDGGQLFIYALIVFVGSAIILWIHREDYKKYLNLFAKSNT